MRLRLWQYMRARRGGYFWLPCPVCHEYTGGHEWKDVNGHRSSIPVWGDNQNLSEGICRNCTRRGYGDALHALRPWLALAILAAVMLTACVPPTPQLIPPREEWPCNATPGYSGPERCVLWERTTTGTIVHGPRWMFAFDQTHPPFDAVLVEQT